MPANQVTVYQPSQNNQPSTAFMGLRQQLHNAARRHYEARVNFINGVLND